MHYRKKTTSGGGNAKGIEELTDISPVAWQHILLTGHYTVHPSAKLAEEKGIYSHLLNYSTRRKDVVIASKVRVARKYVEAYPADLSILDLKPMMEKLRTFITSCN
ncbi:hypothetical protein ACLEXA_06565 [Pseudescherichia vulneris]